MFVTTAIVGESRRKEPSLSSASRTMYSPFPSRALLPIVFNNPPTTTVGSYPARSRIVAIIEVVVVFPCVRVKDRRPLALKGLRDGSGAEVGARDLVSQIEQYLRNAAHADPTDSDEMNV